jgi:hypothetical protein
MRVVKALLFGVVLMCASIGCVYGRPVPFRGFRWR